MFSWRLLTAKSILWSVRSNLAYLTTGHFNSQYWVQSFNPSILSIYRNTYKCLLTLSLISMTLVKKSPRRVLHNSVTYSLYSHQQFYLIYLLCALHFIWLVSIEHNHFDFWISAILKYCFLIYIDLLISLFHYAVLWYLEFLVPHLFCIFFFYIEVSKYFYSFWMLSVMLGKV